MVQKITEPLARLNYVKNGDGNWIPATPTISTSIGDGRKIVTTAGTRELLSISSVKVSSVIIQAETDNTGVIVVGGATVVAAQATRRGNALTPGDSIVMDIDDLSLIWLDTTVNGDGVTYLWIKE